jgi:MFS transporter, DHA2 family, multidrug resistance protein
VKIQTRNAGLRDWLAIAGGMVGCFMAILDIQITNSSLAPIEGGMGASVDEGSWISTAYLISEIVVIPLTGWFSSVVGLRQYLAVNTALFVLFSIGCAQSNSMIELILYRVGQGFTGGVLIPTGLSVIRRHLPPHQQAIGMSLFGVSATFAPAIGPSLGGWLTENFSWHYLFYLNIAPGILAITLQLYALDREPSKLRELLDGDWLGIGTMALGLGCMTIVLEEGQRHDWYGSAMISTLTVVAAVSLIFFLILELTADKPFINLQLFAVPSIGWSNLLSTVVGAVSYGSLFLIPVYLAEVPRFSTQQIGSVVMWSGLPQLAVFPMMPFLLNNVRPRVLVGTGIVLFAASCFVNAGLTHDVGRDELILPQVIRAVAFPLFAMPLFQLALNGLDLRQTADAASLSNICRNLGGSIGIALLSTITQTREQVHYAAISDRVSANAQAAAGRIDQLTAVFSARGGDAAMAPMQAVATIAGQMHQEAMVMAYSDAFTTLGILLVLALPSVFLLPNIRPSSQQAAVH